MKTERKEEKKERKYLFCELMSAFIVVFFIQNKKKKSSNCLIHTFNHLVYVINNEV